MQVAKRAKSVLKTHFLVILGLALVNCTVNFGEFFVKLLHYIGGISPYKELAEARVGGTLLPRH